VGQG